MSKEYNKVPNIITGKDLDYLSDIFNWNYNAFKKYSNFVNEIKDSEMCSIIEKSLNIFYSNMASILDILQKKGQSNG